NIRAAAIASSSTAVEFHLEEADMTREPSSGTFTAHRASQMPLGRKKAAAAAGSAAFLALAPGVMAGFIPYLLTGWHAAHPSLLARMAGAALIAVGAAVLLHAFARFVTEGLGTPAPVAPTEHL